MAGPYYFGHFLRIGEATYTEHRLLGHGLDELLPRYLVALTVETRGPGIFTPFRYIADIDIPHIDQGIGKFDELQTVPLDFDACLGDECIDSESRCDGAVIAHRVPDFLQRLDPEACPILQRAAVAVGALVVIRREKLQRQIGMRAVNVDDIESGIARATGGVYVELLHLCDVVEIHLLAISQCLELGSVLTRAARRAARFHAGRVGSAVPHFHAGQ